MMSVYVKHAIYMQEPIFKSGENFIGYISDIARVCPH